MQEASLFGVIRIILIILLIYFGLKLLFRWLGPLVLKYMLRRVGKKFGSQFQSFDTDPFKRKTGEVSIDKDPEKQRKSKKEVGEYIDYEEID